MLFHSGICIFDIFDDINHMSINLPFSHFFGFHFFHIQEYPGTPWNFHNLISVAERPAA